jgi:DNA-binding transcriptional LysR family regulator
VARVIDFRALETFVWVARQKSFRAAADRLNTTQPAVSQRIAGLEATLGVALLHRTTRQVALTAKGRVVLDYAERLLAIRTEMIAGVGDPGVRSGTFRLGVAETIVHTWLPRLIEGTAQVFPRLTLEIEVDITPNLASRLADREIDLAIMVGPVTDPAFRTRPLCRYPVRFLASPALGLPRGRIAAKDLLARTIVTFARNTRPHADILELMARHGAGPARIHASASLATIVRMALDALGIAAIPPVIVADELARGELRDVATDARLPELEFVAAWRDAPEADVLATILALAERAAAGPVTPRRRGGGRRTGGPSPKAGRARSRPS